MTQLAERPALAFDVPREAEQYEAVFCPEERCKRHGPEVSGAWASVRWRCKKCGEYREVKRG